ncbi:Uma2 family endonuclease [Rippkaea orientalis]|uniref:Uma2 family endonuclease n=1 Tax=Rippkaea orientalis TaxID=2546366 RepID=UPI0001723A33|nr:Uma2 family endonuclease [Rippkaea orientalis]
MGIPEYWIIDYAALGGRNFIGTPKQPTVSIYQLVEGEYQQNQFTDQNPILSRTFPNLNLTVGQLIDINQ